MNYKLICNYTYFKYALVPEKMNDDQCSYDDVTIFSVDQWRHVGYVVQR